MWDWRWGALLCACVLTAACDNNNGDGFVDADDPNLITSFLTGSDSVVVDVPRDGCLVDEVVLETATGVRLVIAAGTCLSRRIGGFVRGPLEIHLDDGAPDVAWLEGQVGAALGGSFRVWASVPSGGDRVDLAFDPPARLELADVLGQYSGTWVLESFVEMLEDSQLAGTPPGEPPSGIRYERYNFTRGVGDNGSVLIPVSTLTGARLDDETLPPAGFECAGEVVHTQVLGPVGSEYPRVCAVNLVVPGSALTLAVGAWYPGLWVPGQSRVIGPGRSIEVRVVERDGNRVVEICSPYKNRVAVLTTCCTGPELDDRESKFEYTAETDGEADLDGPYDGAIEIELLTWGGMRARIDARNTIKEAGGGAFYTTVDRTRSLGYGGCMRTQLRVFGHSESVRRYATLLPPSWQFEFGERNIKIVVPCPPPLTVARTDGENVIRVVDPIDLEVDLTSDPLSGNADHVVVFPDDLAIVATAEIADLVSIPGALHRVDLVTGAVLQTMTMPGLSTAIAAHPFGDRLLVATADGVLRTLDPSDLSEISRIEGLPPGPYDHLVVSPDGASAFAVRRLQGGAELQGAAPGAVVDVYLFDEGSGEPVAGTEGMVVRALDVSVNGFLGLIAEAPQAELVLLGNGIDLRSPLSVVASALSFTSDGSRLLVGTDNGVVDLDANLQNPVPVPDTQGTSSLLLFTFLDQLHVLGVRAGTDNLFRSTNDGSGYTNPLGGPVPPITDLHAFGR